MAWSQRHESFVKFTSKNSISGPFLGIGSIPTFQSSSIGIRQASICDPGRRNNEREMLDILAVLADGGGRPELTLMLRMGHGRAVSSINLSHKFCLFCRRSNKEETSKKFNNICIFFWGGGNYRLGGCKQGDVGGSPHYPDKNTQHIQMKCIHFKLT
jgi:hypothetical protein